MTSDQTNLDQLRRGLEKTLNTHGFSFQQAVAKAARDLFGQKRSPWRLPTTEFPVEANGQATRIDIVLQHRDRSLWLVCECKRANPALSDWCFLKAPLTARGSLAERVYGESLVWPSTDQTPTTRATELYYPSERIYHLGLEVKGVRKGDAQGKGPGAIEEAATQVLRGLNGLVEFLASSPRAASELGTITLLPAVFTTARLWVSDADLSQADLKSGDLTSESHTLQAADWLWFQYPQSPGLKHSLGVQLDGPYDDILAQALYSVFVRPIAIVNSAGLESFLANRHFID